jgi:hypothetical protein
MAKGLDRSMVDKINELVDALNENDRLLEKQEDILYEEHDKLVNAEKYLALEVKRNELLSSKVSSCNDFISSLKILNVDLNAKIEKVNAFKGVLDGKLYLVDFSKENANLDSCLIAKTNMGWL